MERYTEYKARCIRSLAVVFTVMLAWFLVATKTVARQENLSAPRDSWKTGASFRTALNKRIRFQSTGTLKEDLESLSRNTKVAIFLDRDIDPSAKIGFPTESLPLGLTLDLVATQLKGLALTVGSFVYIAPREKALRLLLLRNAHAYEFSRIDSPVREKLQRATELSWSYLANPKDTITVLAANCDLTVSNPDVIPHDLWASQSLPRLTNGEQLTFLLACMNRSFKVDAGKSSIEVIPISDQQQVTLRFRTSERRKIEQVLAKHKLGQTKTVARGTDFFVRGPLKENLVLIDQMRSPRKWKNRVKAGSKDVYDLNTEASRGNILATIAKNQNVKLGFAPSLSEILEQKITIQVKQATMEELLAETLKGTGLRYQITETQLLIVK